MVVGADRIAQNGDTANKIGTYGLALLAKAHRVQFVVAAPTSTIDRKLATGAGSRSRSGRQGRSGASGRPDRPRDQGLDPAFDVTGDPVSAIVTEDGVIAAPYIGRLASPGG